jgi:hypothetical protein
MHDSFKKIILNESIDDFMNEKCDLYNKINTFAIKTKAYLVGIIAKDFTSKGYEFCNLKESHESIENYSFVYLNKINQSDGTDITNLMRFILNLYYNEHDSEGVKFIYDSLLKKSFYLSNIEENWIFCVVFEQNKIEQKTKTNFFIQEICDELNMNSLFLLFNSNLK